MRPGDGPVVAGFVAGGFRVDQGVYRAMLLTPERVEEWVPPPFEALTAGDLAPLLALDPRPEFILLGTGARMLRPSRALVAALEGEGVGIEPMDSRAAARAWGVLRAEGRWVAGAFYPLV
jgi:uncharacterized protein